jgi:hypothetical protein
LRMWTIKQSIEFLTSPISQFFSRHSSWLIGNNTLGINLLAGGDGGGGGESISSPFFDPTADINGTVVGSIKLLPDGICEVEDDGKGPNSWADAFSEAFNDFMDWIDEKSGSRETREKTIGGPVDFFLHFTYDIPNGFMVNGVTVRNNSSEAILLTHASVSVNGIIYLIAVKDAPVFINPGEVVNIFLTQEESGPFWYTDAVVTFFGCRPDSCDPSLKDLITITIPKKD